MSFGLFSSLGTPSSLPANPGQYELLHSHSVVSPQALFNPEFGSPTVVKLDLREAGSYPSYELHISELPVKGYGMQLTVPTSSYLSTLMQAPPSTTALNNSKNSDSEATIFRLASDGCGVVDATWEVLFLFVHFSVIDFQP